MKPKELICKRCGYKWTPRKKAPKSCPECKSRSWNRGLKRVISENDLTTMPEEQQKLLKGWKGYK